MLGCNREDAVTAKTENRALLITNASDETIYYIVYPSHVMQYVTIKPSCSDENAITPHSTKSVPYEEVLRTGNDEEAVIYWWRCDEGKKETGIGNAKLIRIKL